MDYQHIKKRDSQSQSQIQSKSESLSNHSLGSTTTPFSESKTMENESTNDKNNEEKTGEEKKQVIDSPTSNTAALLTSPVLSPNVPTLNRISVLDRICGCPLFDKIWKWKEDQKSPSACAGLIKSFYQFAREIDNGVVSRVAFESPSSSKPARDSAIRQRENKTISRARRPPKISVLETYTIEMYCAQNESIIVALFVSGAFMNAEDMVSLLVDKFSKQFKDVLDKLKPVFHENAKNPDQALLDLSFLPKFSSFEEAVNQLVQ